MDYIHIKNLDKYQPTYKDGRNLLWIRWDIKAMRDYKLSKLSPAGRWLFLVLICLETENHNPLPADEGWLAKESGIGKRHIHKELLMLQTLQLVVTSCDNLSPTYVHTDIHTNKQNTSFPFEELWLKYPSKVGRREAERHFEVSVKTQEDFVAIQTALENYLKSERVKKGFVQNGSTWFNNWKDWVNYKEPPQEKDKADAYRQELEKKEEEKLERWKRESGGVSKTPEIKQLMKNIGKPVIANGTEGMRRGE